MRLLCFKYFCFACFCECVFIVFKLWTSTTVRAIVTHVVAPVADLSCFVKNKRILARQLVGHSKAAVAELWAAWRRLKKTAFLVVIWTFKADANISRWSRLHSVLGFLPLQRIE